MDVREDIRNSLFIKKDTEKKEDDSIDIIGLIPQGKFKDNLIRSILSNKDEQLKQSIQKQKIQINEEYLLKEEKS